MSELLLLGARGLLGTELARELGASFDLLATSRSGGGGAEALDLCDEAALARALDHHAPRIVVNSAAYTAVDRAEEEREQAYAINATAVGTLGRLCAERGIRVVHVSTDFVFDGSKDGPYLESDPVGPAGVYARSKAEGERLLVESGATHLIVRVAWLFGPAGGNFVATMLRLGSKGPLRVVSDQWGTPTFSRDAARGISRAIEADLEGIVHCANQGTTTWHGLAAKALSLAGIGGLPTPIATGDWPTPAPRPRNSALRNAVLEETIGDPMRPWEEALADYIALLNES